MSDEDQMAFMQHLIGEIALSKALASMAHEYIMVNMTPTDRIEYGRKLTDQFARSILEVANTGAIDLATASLKVAELQAYFEERFAEQLGKPKNPDSTDKQ